MTDQWTPEQDAAFLAAAGDASETPAIQSAPAAALEASRVDLIDLIRNGIPEPQHVPGGAPWLRKGKRYLIPAPAGTGKSLAGLIIAVTTIEHGGTALILDVENGADEYARRLEAILNARDHDGSLTRACQERLSYHTWPNLSLHWAAEDWAAAVRGTDLVIFDSSRLTLSSIGLAEDSNDEYSQFITSLVIPLAQAGTTTIILDNTGHSDKDRARGASTKADLNEVVYMLEVVKGKEFDRDTPGQLRLKRTRSRFSALPEELRMDIGGNTYTAPVEPADTPGTRKPFRPTQVREEVSKAIESNPGLGKRELRTMVGRGTETFDLAIGLLIAESFVQAPVQNRSGTKNPHHSLKPYRRAEDPKDPHRDPVTEPCPNRDPRHGSGDRDSVPPPLRARSRSNHTPDTAQTPNRDSQDQA